MAVVSLAAWSINNFYCPFIYWIAYIWLAAYGGVAHSTCQWSLCFVSSLMTDLIVLKHLVMLFSFIDTIGVLAGGTNSGLLGDHVGVAVQEAQHQQAALSE